MKSALFVDFDNVYSQLRQLQPEAAERFARQLQNVSLDQGVIQVGGE